VAAEDIEIRLSGAEKRSLHEAKLSGSSRWLGAIPLEEPGYALTRQTFRDAIAIRMGIPVPDPLPPECPSCGADADLAHLLKCPFGGWIRRRHNEVQRELIRLMKQVCDVVIAEPVLPPVQGPAFLEKGTTTDDNARPDILARGFFEPQIDVYFDVTIGDTAQKSALDKGLTPETVLLRAERDQRRKYQERVERIGGRFVPFAASVYGTLAEDSERTILTLMKKLSEKTGNRKTSEACARLRIQLAIIRATSLCIRTRSHDNPQSGAPKVDAQEEEELDLDSQWFDLRTTLGE